MNPNAATFQPTNTRDEHCRFHEYNYICPDTCPFVHGPCPFPKLEEEHFPEWMNMMLRSLKENQRLMCKQAAQHRDRSDKRLLAIENQIRSLTEQVSQFSFAQGVSLRPATNLGDRPVPNQTRYPTAAPEFFYQQRLDGPRRGRNPNRGARGGVGYRPRRSQSTDPRGFRDTDQQSEITE
ncbi:MAG: hypothetical protein [brine shrimp arlivirus 6]|nr:MAG: hypothetical protein [brine shrimp arlivirus 6]UNI74103.1 MAG: hypothetical protein [brine shrimp arlivirus 6]UNI74108.1 MAG: hypothetical protein [brine shrimp arlivirus 6]UNI74113.1 MAG: hypothetical protein [brine shrimp arlivirus 6]